MSVKWDGDWQALAMPEPNSGCWIWMGRMASTGYGMTPQWRSELAHRYAMKAMGHEISGKVIAHKCDNRACVNPDHLHVGDQKWNMRDAYSKGICKRGEEKNGSKFTNAQVKEMRESGLGPTALSKIYGISPGHACNILKGRLYKLPDPDQDRDTPF